MSSGIKVQRGRESWDYIYTTLGFTLTIEGVLVSYVPFPHWQANIFIAGSLFILTIKCFLESEWLHNELIGIKERYENEWR